MKTYRLYSLRLLIGKENGVLQRDIPLVDGLIINMEDNGKKWLLDAVISSDKKSVFEEIETSEKFILEVVITSKNNHPATMVAKVRKLTELSVNVSVLIDGILVNRKDDIVDLVLQGMVDENVSGESIVPELEKEPKQNIEKESTQ
ncbi:YwpF family protein [Bacillus sp. FJAT-45350]|uniref:YwpF family protein n=1 Tax=Bacillus sp. FJAT-45350 TaxID=2011014 RepID=UPI0015CDBD0F|nr:YwpF family protein [Bacillus sp. FJAT-45350]